MIIIPLRALTTIIGLMLGYTAGIYIEILHEKQHNYRPEVIALIAALHQSASTDEGEYTPGYDDDIATLCFNGTNTSDSDSSESDEDI